jgi:uncharacterized membrane protein YbhN (UPF0104 family)
MTSAVPVSTAPIWRRRLGILAALVLFAAAVEWLVGWRSVLAAASRLSPTDAAVLLTGLVASYLLRGARVYFYFHRELAGRFLATLRLTLIHNAAANLLPLRAGELSFPLLAKREFDLAPARTIAALIWFRLLDLMLLTCIALAVIAAGVDSAAATAAWLPTLALPAVVLLVSRNRLLSLAERMPQRVRRLIKQAADGLPVSHSAALRDLLITAGNWATKLLALGATFVALAGDPSWQAGIAAAAGEVSGILPVATPAGLGAYEAAVVAAALPFGVTAAVGLQAAITLHLLILATSLAGFAVAAWLPKS